MLQKTIACLAFLLTLLFALETYWLISHHPFIAHFDQSIIAHVQGHITPGKTLLAKFFTSFANVPTLMFAMAVLTALVYRLSHSKVESLWFFSQQILGAGALNGLFKEIIARPRPTLLRLDQIGGYSFPSGHTMGAIICYGLFSLWLYHFQKRYSPGAGLAGILGRIPTATYLLLCASTGLLIVGIGWSRIYLGVHYPSDVLAGALLGTDWLCLAFLSRKYFLISRSIH